MSRFAHAHTLGAARSVSVSRGVSAADYGNRPKMRRLNPSIQSSIGTAPF
jgi:hypothetical protein